MELANLWKQVRKIVTDKLKIGTDRLEEISGGRGVLPQRCWQKVLAGSSRRDVS